MPHRFPLAALLASLAFSAWASTAGAIDSVRTADGQAISGDVQTVTRSEITIKPVGKDEQKIPANTVQSIRYGDEPAQLNLVRSAINSNNHNAALEMLNNAALDPNTVNRLEVKQDILFYKALAKAQQALAGEGDVREAGRAMLDFVSQHPQSYRYYQAEEMVGDLLVAIGQYDQAVEHYAKLETAPWKDYQMRAAVAKGRALQKQEKHAEALAEFEKALAAAEPGAADPLVQNQRLAATAGKAACLAETGNADEGAQLIQGVIDNADPEQSQLHAIAYTVLGNCHLKANRPKEALLAFLHVDVLYYNYPEYHAEALYHLGNLWKVAGQPERGVQAQQILATRYSQSPWAQKQ